MQQMFQAMITCPTTGKSVPTGFAFGDLAAFDSTTLVNNTVRCKECGEGHLVDNTTVKVFPNEIS
jgi:hypothetical protein